MRLLTISQLWMKSMKFKCWYQNLVIWISKFLIHFKWRLFDQNFLHLGKNIERRCCILQTIIPLNSFKHTCKLRFNLICVNCKEQILKWIWLPKLVWQWLKTICKYKRKETNSRRNKMLIRSIEFVSIVEIKGTT